MTARQQEVNGADLAHAWWRSPAPHSNVLPRFFFQPEHDDIIVSLLWPRDCENGPRNSPVCSPSLLVIRLGSTRVGRGESEVHCPFIYCWHIYEPCQLNMACPTLQDFFPSLSLCLSLPTSFLVSVSPFLSLSDPRSPPPSLSLTWTWSKLMPFIL